MKIVIFNRNSLTNLVVAITSIFVLVFFLEVGIRLWGTHHRQSFISNPENKLATINNNIIPFRTFGYKLYTFENNQKYILDRYGQKYPYLKNENTFRIVCLGGSTTENYSNYQKSGIHYPLLLEKLLQQQYPNKKIEVINTSFAAYSTVHSIILLAFDVIYWKPDLVILNHNINDLTASYWPNFTTDYSNKFSHPFYSNPTYSANVSVLDALFQHLRIYWWIKKRIELIKANKQVTSIKRISYGTEPPKEGLEVFKTNLKTFITIAQENNIPVLLTTEPFEPSVEMFNRHLPNKAYNDIVTYPLQNELIAHHHRYNREIIKTAEDNKTMVIDLDQEFGANKEYFTDLVHYTDTGVQLVAKNIASFIQNQGLIKDNVAFLKKNGR